MDGEKGMYVSLAGVATNQQQRRRYVLNYSSILVWVVGLDDRQKRRCLPSCKPDPILQRRRRTEFSFKFGIEAGYPACFRRRRLSRLAGLAR